MPKIAIRVSDALYEELQSKAQERGFQSVSALVRHAIQSELREGEPVSAEIEERIAATLNRVAKDVRASHTAHLATFALIDSLVKLFLTCVPEPPVETLDAAKARGRRRYEKFLVSVAQAMSGESRGILKELSRVDS
jgi:hypothetical protein